jgi:hypothetical protein
MSAAVLARNADGVLRRAYPGRLFVLYGTVGYDHTAGTVHARALDQSNFYGVSHRHVREPSPARQGDAGHTGPENLLGVPGRPQGVEFRSRGTLTPGFSRQFRIAVGKVGMGIDEPRHDPLSGGVDNLHIVSVFQLYVAGKTSRAFDAITLDYNGLIPSRRIPSAVDQGSVRDHDGLFTVGDHVNLLLYG